MTILALMVEFKSYFAPRNKLPVKLSCLQGHKLTFFSLSPYLWGINAHIPDPLPRI